jgi:hypothetical protein
MLSHSRRNTIMWRRMARSAEQAADDAYRVAALRRDASGKLDKERREAAEPLSIEPDLELPRRRPAPRGHERHPDQTWSRS